MARKREAKSRWVAPRSGGYSAKTTRSATTGRSVKKSESPRPVTGVTVKVTAKPTPPRGRAAASVAVRKEKSE